MRTFVRRKLLAILACPIDKHYPLRMVELSADSEKVTDGVLLCDQCGRYYPIIDEIPVMLPDDLRNKKEDLEFLTRWREKLPQGLPEKGLPHNLS